MGIRIYSHNKALELLQSSFHGLAYQELVEFLHRIPLIRFAEKSANTAGLEFLQTCMNQLLNDVLKLQYGWHTQVDMPGGCDENNVDFYKKWSRNFRAWMEVEFGNVARLDCDIRKLRSAFERKLSEIGILLVPTQRLAKRFDRNVASFERAVTLLSVDKSNCYPVLVVGLELDDSKVVDVTNWGYALNELKGSSHLEVKSHLAKRVWEEHMLPTLPANSMHARHVELTRLLGYNPAVRKPVFKDFVAEVVPTPDVLMLNEDGTFSTYVPPQKERKAKPAKEGKTGAVKKAAKPAAKKTATPVEQPQLELALALPTDASSEASSEAPAACSASTLDVAAQSVVQPTPPTDSAAAPQKDTAKESSLLAVEPNANPPHILASEPQRSGSPPIIVAPLPAAKPVLSTTPGPRMGPWLSRMGAAASPFVSSFA